MKRTNEVLERFGFTEPESELYLTILSLGKPSVTQVAKKLEKNRAAVYFHLKHLLEKGVVKETREGRRFRFIAVLPAELAATFDRWTTEFKSMIPELESLYRKEQEAPVIEISESKRGYLRVYDELASLPVGSEFRAMEGVAALKGELGLLTDEEWGGFFSRIAERKILAKLIFTKEALATAPPQQSLSPENMKLVRQRLWDLRILPESTLPLQCLVIIYGDKAAFLLPEVKLVVTIAHAGITGALRATFDAVFSFATPRVPAWD